MSEVRKLLAERARARDWTDDELVLLASHRTIEINPYNPNDRQLLAQAKRLTIAGRLKFVCEDRRKFYYRATQIHQK